MSGNISGTSAVNPAPSASSASASASASLSPSDPNLRDKIVAGSGSFWAMIANARALDPALADQLEGKALIASKSPWGTLLGGIIGWAAAHYGLNVDPNTQAIIAGAGVLIGSYIMRYVTKGPVTGIIAKGDPAQNPAAPT